MVRDGELGIDGLTEVEPIGSGGFADVYRAFQERFARWVAVKVLRTGDLDDTARSRFERECRALGTLSAHPGIVTVYDGGFTADGSPYLMMQYYPLGSLEDRIARDGPLDWAEAARHGEVLADSLAAAHRAEIVHRDIKPANVLVGEHGNVAISDFGIARIAGATETKSGVITASLAHAPPEILDGARPSPQSDVYSLGSTIYEMVAGRPAFLDDDQAMVRLLARIAQDPVPDLRAQGAPDALAEAIERAMAKDPAERWPDATSFARALGAARHADGGPPVARNAPTAPRLAPTPAPPPPSPPDEPPASEPAQRRPGPTPTTAPATSTTAFPAPEPPPAYPPPPPEPPPAHPPPAPEPPPAYPPPPPEPPPAHPHPTAAAPPGYSYVFGAAPPQAYAVPVPVRTSRPNGLATASLVLSILWLCWLGSFLGVLFGLIALGQIKGSGGTQTGAGQAWAGIVVGGIGLLALVVLAANGASGSG